MHLAITGASGFVGQSVLESLESRVSHLPITNLTLIVHQASVGISETLQSKCQVDVLARDLTEPWDLPSGITHLLHLAADGSRNPYSEDAAKAFVAIAEGLSAWARSVNQLKRVIHASSGACYGFVPIPGLYGSSPTKEWGKTTFVNGRLFAETLLAQKLGNHCEFVIARLFSFSGSNLLSRSQYALVQFIIQGLRTGEIVIEGHPATQRSYLDQRDLGDWLVQSLSFEPRSNGQILNIGSDIAVSMREVAEFVAKLTNSRITERQNSFTPDRYVADISETTRLLNVSQTVLWEDSVIEMIRQAKDSWAYWKGGS